MEEVTVKCGCGRTMALDARRGRGAYRCGCRVTIQIIENPQTGDVCVGTGPDGTACREAAVITDPLFLCHHHYVSTGLRQYHKWRVSGPEVLATDIGSFFDAVAFGRTDEGTPKELLDLRAEYLAKRPQLDAEREARLEARRHQEPDEEHIQRGGQVYFMRLDDRVKIGKTYDVARRLASFSNPLMLLLATEPGYTNRERQLHNRFAGLKVAGEWYRLEAPLTDYIRSLPTYRRSIDLPH